MAIVAYNTKELDLLARLMRAEATGEGNLGMLMVGNVGINRVIGNCLDFKNITSIYQMVYQEAARRPGPPPAPTGPFRPRCAAPAPGALPAADAHIPA